MKEFPVHLWRISASFQGSCCPKYRAEYEVEVPYFGLFDKLRVGSRMVPHAHENTYNPRVKVALSWLAIARDRHDGGHTPGW